VPLETGCQIALDALVELEIAEAISSTRQKRGDKFALKLHAPVTCDGTTLIPTDTTGIGEIVHAEPSHGGGKPGELLIAARYLELNGTRWRLRGLKLGGKGQDKTNEAVAASFALGPFALFIHGKEIEIPAGTLVTAKLAQDLPPSGASTNFTTAPTLPVTSAQQE